MIWVCKCRRVFFRFCCGSRDLLMFGSAILNEHHRHAFDVRQNGHGSPAGRTAQPKEPTASNGHGLPEQIERLLPQNHRLLLHSSTHTKKKMILILIIVLLLNQWKCKLFCWRMFRLEFVDLLSVTQSSALLCSSPWKRKPNIHWHKKWLFDVDPASTTCGTVTKNY